MSARPLEPQECEHDGITLHFERGRLAEGAWDWSYRVIGEKHMCPGCAEERGADHDDASDVPDGLQ